MSVGRASRSLSSILLALMILAPDTVAKDREANVELPVTWKFGENYWLERIKERRQYNGTSLQLSPCGAAGPPGGAGGVYGSSGGLGTQVTALVALRAADGLDDALQAPRHSRARAAQMDNRAGPGRARTIDVSGHLSTLPEYLSTEDLEALQIRLAPPSTVDGPELGFF